MRLALLEPYADEELLAVQDEPALDIALPQVFEQPTLTVLQRGKLPQVERFIAQLYHRRLGQNGTTTLGPDYQLLVNEFQPLFTWAIACWDFLLTTEGCRFLLRNGDEKLCNRGDYRAVTDTDYSRLVHRVFRSCVLEFAAAPTETSFTAFLRVRFWDAVVQAYRHLEHPPDARQRNLTPYSYLRCAPYQFLNAFHHELVHAALRRLPTFELRAIDRYFLNFYTLPATAEALTVPEEAAEEALRRGLLVLLVEHRLVYCLLRQIERY